MGCYYPYFVIRCRHKAAGVAFNTLLVLALFTVTLDKASLALIKPFTTLLKDSPFFVEVKKEEDFAAEVAAQMNA
jgi:hypothetical protein